MTPSPKPGRGGARRGAGAPKGNLNALKHGRHSRRFIMGVIVLHLYPEFAETLRALARSSGPRSPWRRRAGPNPFNRTIAEAVRFAANVADQDPVLAQSIKEIVQKRLENAVLQIQDAKKS